jgi:acylpyruvate hydrolase
MRVGTIEHSDGSAAIVMSDAGAHIVGDRHGRIYADVGELLRAGPTGQDDAARALHGPAIEELDEARLLRPVLQPGAVVAVGLNYAGHIQEMGRELPTSPTLFSMLPRALTDPYADIALPRAAPGRVDYEGELGIVIGAGGRNLGRADAAEAIAGLTIVNDVTMRDYQRRSVQWFAGKTWERSTPLGPWVTSLDELDLSSMELLVTVNGEQRQRALVADLVFDVLDLVCDVSRIVTLEPGDLIATGTPGGVADAADPPAYLRDGDVCEVAITGLGTLRNVFRAERETDEPWRRLGTAGAVR